jgi:hypothetical protein
MYIVIALISKQTSGDNFVLWYLFLLLIVVMYIIFVFSNYIKNYLDKKDDLTGETDGLKQILEDDERSSNKWITFNKILALFFCLILCYSITMSCFPVLTLAIGKEWLGDNLDLNSAYISVLFNTFDLLGKISYKWIKMKDNFLIYIVSLSRLLLVVGYILASDSDFKGKMVKQQWFGYMLLIVLSYSNGYFTTVAYVLATLRCDNKQKKTSGYLMTTSLFLGLVYGSLISAICLESKSVPAN